MNFWFLFTPLLFIYLFITSGGSIWVLDTFCSLRWVETEILKGVDMPLTTPGCLLSACSDSIKRAAHYTKPVMAVHYGSQFDPPHPSITKTLRQCQWWSSPGMNSCCCWISHHSIDGHKIWNRGQGEKKKREGMEGSLLGWLLGPV